ncbi:MAG TPA: alanine--tRNA ligase-related protein [Ktedonobacteraceae bacterium]|nr:alanine--tRNA ligase-related protein [Ktedonobacteraceae bacterium]
MTGDQLRQAFLTFCREWRHAILPSAPLVPENDPTVLFTTAGMHPLVPYILGETHPKGRRLANVQKCLRTDDIEEVGDISHLTFFEMLGFWSLGDYWKQDSLRWTLEWFTTVLGLEQERISVTVFAGDSDAPRDAEAEQVWLSLGSNITPQRLRFDFSHPQKLTGEEILRVEGIVNRQIERDLQTQMEVMSLEQALKQGALAFFGERYADIVKVYQIGDYSMEVCGGPHVAHTAGIPYAVPTAERLAERLDGVLVVLYLIFNEGYTASMGNTLMRRDLCAEAIRLCRALIALMADEPSLQVEPEVMGLLALMLLHDSRRDARVNAQGEMVVLEEQDRSLWDKAAIAEGTAMLECALHMHQPGTYQIQAAIAALHAQASCPAETDWLQIAMLYSELVKRHPSLVVRLNWAVAVAMASEPARGLEMLDELDATGDLKKYHLFHATRADFLRRAGNWQTASEAYRQALNLAQNTVERALLNRRLAEVQANM